MSSYRGGHQWRAQFARDKRQFDRMFPVMFVLAGVLAVAVTATLIVGVVNGSVPWWVLLLVGR